MPRLLRSVDEELWDLASRCKFQAPKNWLTEIPALAMGILLLGQYCCLRTKLKAFLEALDLGFPCHKGSQWPQKSLSPSPSFRPHSISQSQTQENSRGTLVLKTSQSALGGWQHGHPLAACWKHRMSGPAQAYWLAKKGFLVTCLHVNV